jgi:hypothetical protein
VGLYQTIKVLRSSQEDLISGLLQTLPQREAGLNVACGTSGEDRDTHRIFSSATSYASLLI